MLGQTVAKVDASVHLQVESVEEGPQQVQSIFLRQGRQISHRRKSCLGLGCAGLALLGMAAWLCFSGMDLQTLSSRLAKYHARVVELPFVQATLLIFVSEIGDKTFFIAAILGSRASKLLTFVGCIAALVGMTIAAVIIGHIVRSVPSSFTNGFPIVDYIAIASFILFGLKALKDAYAVESDGKAMAEEREEAEKELAESGAISKSGFALVFEACMLTTVAELGDRSQIATIALASTHNAVVVCFGAILGHCVATGIAVLSGSLASRYLSERVIGIIGGVLFLVFALTTALDVF